MPLDNRSKVVLGTIVTLVVALSLLACSFGAPAAPTATPLAAKLTPTGPAGQATPGKATATPAKGGPAVPADLPSRISGSFEKIESLPSYHMEFLLKSEGETLVIRGDFVGKDSHVWIEDKGKKSEFYSIKDHGYSVENGKVTDMGEGSGAIVGLWKLSYLGAAMGLAVASGGQITPQGSEVVNGRNTDKYVADSTVLTALLGKAKAMVNIDKETGALVKMISDWKAKDAKSGKETDLHAELEISKIGQIGEIKAPK